MKIIGAGMAGCIAAHIFPESTIYEAAPGPKAMHHALLRFKSDAIGEAVGIPFKKVEIQKAIWFDGKEVSPSPRMSALYSKKVTGEYLQRSITKLEASTRFIAPDDFHMQMLERLKHRIEYSHPITVDTFHSLLPSPIISTIPINLLAEATGAHIEKKSEAKQIYVANATIGNCNMYCTIYYPSEDTSVYRASITGSKLIVESVEPVMQSDIIMVCDSFGMRLFELSNITTYTQNNGKIIPDETGSHKAFVHDMTMRYGIYSLGRFALWRNILLDDVLCDCLKIRKMVNQDNYSRHLTRSFT